MKKFIISIPVYNDWKSVFKLLENIDVQIKDWDAEVSVLIVNDASTEERPKTEISFKEIKSVRVVNMKQNRGHARCNAAGLKYLTEKENFDYVIVMDGDGEDRPEELTPLFNKSKENPSKTVPKVDAARLAKEACIWSSFSGSVTKVISDRVSVPSIRGQRYFGPSHMNLFNLLIHSVSIIAVFRGAAIVRSVLFLLIYLFFVSNSLSVITLFPALAVLIFLLSILKVSSRENIEELNNSLENIGSIDVLSDLNSG